MYGRRLRGVVAQLWQPLWTHGSAQLSREDRIDLQHARAKIAIGNLTNTIESSM